jgi:diaminopimelate decarboxylase
MSPHKDDMVKMRQSDLQKLSLFPVTREVDNSGHLHIGGCDCVNLVKEFGSPLYVFDELTIRSKCQEFRTEFAKRYSNTLVIYAAKAFLNQALATILKQEGLGLDIVSGGELSLAQLVDFPRENTYFHGNNKTPAELKLALDWKIGRIVVDNLDELELLDELAGKRKMKQDILLRLNPGVDPHTHRYTTTGILDSKFGFPLATGQASIAVAKATSASNLNPVGLHCHLGSPIADTSPYQVAIGLVIRFAHEMKAKHNFYLAEFSPGGGFAVKYTTDSAIANITDYAEAITTSIIAITDELKLAPPKLVIEPGRAIVAQAGVALYTVGSIKEIPGVRKYVCVDGGMGDNIRPALYEARYEALLANRTSHDDSTSVTIAGKYCESGDILARDVYLGTVSSGDIIAMPVSGAYSIPMSSNYNMVPKPAVVLVKDGKARLIRRREKYQDLMKLDVA